MSWHNEFFKEMGWISDVGKQTVEKFLSMEDSSRTKLLDSLTGRQLKLLEELIEQYEKTLK